MVRKAVVSRVAEGAVGGAGEGGAGAGGGRGGGARAWGSRVAGGAVVGGGYVGLVAGASLALIGHRVTCVDRDGGRVAGLREGRLPFYEPGLEELVARGVGAGRLSFTERLDEAVGLADVAFIAVGTPQGEDGAANLANVSAVARGIGRALARSGRRGGRPLVVANKSTVPVGSGD